MLFLNLHATGNWISHLAARTMSKSYSGRDPGSQASHDAGDGPKETSFLKPTITLNTSAVISLMPSVSSGHKLSPSYSSDTAGRSGPRCGYSSSGSGSAENSLAPRFVLDMYLVPSRRRYGRHGLVVHVDGALRLWVRHRRLYDRPVRVPVYEGQQHLGPLMEGEVHPVVAPRVGLGHPYGGGRLPVFPPRRVEGDDDRVPALGVDLGILPGARRIDLRRQCPRYAGHCGLLLGPELDGGHYRGEGVPVVDAPVLVPHRDAREKVPRLVPLVADPGDEVGLVEAPPVVVL